MKRKYINNGNIKKKKAKCLPGKYKVLDKGKKAKDSVLPLKLLKDFKKKPVVKMERFDLQPYLSKTTHDLLPSQNSRHTFKVNSKSYFNLLGTIKFDCKVNVTKDNLTGILNKINESRLNASTKARLQLINDEYSKFYGDINNSSNSTPIKTDSKNQRKSVSFSDKITVHEIKEYHKCHKCTKIFKKLSKLRAHIRKEHKRKNPYECNYCKKCFVDRFIFKVHIKLHCDVCGFFCKSRSALQTHRRDVCHVTKRYNCNTCQNTFFRYMDLKDHNYEHTNCTFYICDICKEQCRNPCFLGHHIMFLHCMKRPKTMFEVRSLGCDRLYLCRFCDFSSIDKAVMKDHVELLPDYSNRVISEYEDYYFCDQCFNKYDSETGMMLHKWSHYMLKQKNDEKNNQNSDAPEESTSNNENNRTKTKRPQIKIRISKLVLKDMVQRVKLNRKSTLKLVIRKRNKLNEGMMNRNAVHTPKILYNSQEDLPLQFKPYIKLDKTVIPKYFEKKNVNKIVHFIDTAALNETLSSDYNTDESLTFAEDGKRMRDKSARKTKTKYQCEICLKRLSSRHSLKRHCSEVHARSLNCNSCNIIFPTKREKLNHDCSYANVIQPNHSNIDDFNITNDYTSIEDVDFAIPTPVAKAPEIGNCSSTITEPIFEDVATNKNDDSLLRKFISEPPVKHFDCNFMGNSSFGTATTSCNQNVSSTLNQPLNVDGTNGEIKEEVDDYYGDDGQELRLVYI